MYLCRLSYIRGRCILWRGASSTTTSEPPVKATKKKRKPKKHYAEVIQVGAKSTSLVQRRVAKLDPARWSGVHSVPVPVPTPADVSPAPPVVPSIHPPSSTTPSDPTPEASSPVAGSEPDSLSEDVPPAVLAETDEDALPETVPVTPLGCFEPALADEAEGEAEVEEEVSELDITKKLHQKKKRSGGQKRPAGSREKAAALRLMEQQAAGKQASFISSLKCYLEVCVNSGLVNRAYNTLLYYRNMNRNFQRTTDVRDVRLYNVLLAGFARKGQLDRVLDALRVMRDDQVRPDAETFALAFQCLGRQPRTAENVRNARRLLRDMDEAGVRMEDAGVRGSARSLGVQALSWADPERARAWPPEPVLYNCPLVDHLNADLETKQVEPPALGVDLGRSYRELAREQISTELAGTLTVASVYRPKDEPTPRSKEHSNAYMSRLESDWEASLTAGFLRNLSPVRQQFHSNQMSRCISLYPYLTGMDVREYVRLMMTEIQGHLSGSGQVALGRAALHRRLGELAMKRYQSHVKQTSGLVDRVLSVYDRYLEAYQDPAAAGYVPRERWSRLAAERRDGADLEYRERGWSPVIISSVGQFLYKLILHDVKIDPSITKLAKLTEHPIPAFYTVFNRDGARHKEVVRPHPALARLYRATRRHQITFDANLVPMVSPPLPWSSQLAGGYLMSSAPLMRVRAASAETSCQLQRLQETPTQQLFPVLDSLNQLGAIPWVINQKVLDVVLHVFNNDGDESLDIPAPVSLLPPLPTIEPTMTPSEKFKVKQQRVQLNRKKAEQFGLWCDALYKLSLANHFRDRVLWLPHTVDFRGRAYPCPPHLSHLGSDLSRSLLKFARGKPLGQSGLDWLKVHLINLTGLKKRDPTSERLRYCDEIIDDILDSADRPLTGSGWWRTSEEPWQTLSSCQELAAALRSPDPAAFVSHLPVHQDGSCNGLQHYAALGRDSAGAASVNLSPAERPQDVYSGVAALVEQLRQKDAADGLPIAAALDGFVRRKVIKQTVMTTVYGVTRYGARLQIAKQLKDIPDFPKEHVWQGSHYLVTRTFMSLQQMFTAAKEIQDWFTECARVVSSVRSESVEWVTPLGLPVVQPYVRSNHKTAVRPLSETGRMSRPHFTHEAYERPNAIKQRNAFPPNFIHSLDSSHMMLTSLHCLHAGITFVSVHDCYWTHASTVDQMNKVCREQFVALHSRPLLEELSEGLLARFGIPPDTESGSGSGSGSGAIPEGFPRDRVNRVLAAVPELGEFDLREVLRSPYFFS
ncbi:DNA-directed RNA polymerase, mitochondrial-like [Amphibalanus amphitrite]|uniref:DNA-directed RNA polymerase, mitochondrial-like n=1 Tax=Amphibalanus amphitrite TaxID=1232801 RepID=UPI001C91ABDD|nr:DNA-directed RNA polymerase, mitochondrial-like [Amphibalanus amphitrite]